MRRMRLPGEQFQWVKEGQAAEECRHGVDARPLSIAGGEF
jgi:hypothetical protein